METKSTERTAYSVLPTAEPVIDREQIEERRVLVKAIKAINATEMFGENNELTFVLDRETRKPLLRIVDRETREVIRQLPPEDTLRLARQMNSP